jgi:type II secretion system protein H
MKRNNQFLISLALSQRGFTLMELLVVVGVIAIMAAMAIPTFVSWRQSIEYRQAARELGAALRDARTHAISDNRQYVVQLDAANRAFQFRRGDAATNSAIWENITRPGPQAASDPDPIWIFLPTRITVVSDAGVTEVRFSPNGTATFNVAANQAVIRIQDDAAPPADRFGVIVTPTGRIQIRQAPIP